MSNTWDGVPELEQLRAQRAELADRVRAPWWYLAAFAVSLAVVCAVPVASHYSSIAGGWPDLAALAVFYLLQAALARVSGVSIGTRTLRYPSGRAAGVAMIVVVVAAVVAEGLLLRHGLLAAAVATGLAGAVAGTGCQLAHLRGIRRDLRAGRGAA
jgi:hypothetical protein